jgi:two-component system NarL family sensor kinase
MHLGNFVNRRFIAIYGTANSRYLITNIILILCVYFCNCYKLFAQDSTSIRQAEHFFESSLSNKNIMTLIAQGKREYKENKAEQAINTMLKALEYSQRNLYAEGNDTALKYFAAYIHQWHTGNITTRQMKLIEKAQLFAYSNKSKNRYRTILHRMKGSYYTDNGKYAQALMEQEKAFSLLPEDTFRNTYRSRCEINIDISSIWSNLGEKEQARKALDNAEKIALQHHFPHQLIAINKNRGIMHFNVEEMDSAYYYLNKSLNLVHDKNNENPNCNCRLFTVANLCLVLLQQHKPNEVLHLIDQTLEVLKYKNLEMQRKGYPVEDFNTLSAFLEYLRGYAYYEQRHYTKAINLLEPLLKQVKEKSITQVAANIHSLLAAVYDSTQHYQMAYQHTVAFNTLVHNKEVEKEKSKLFSLRNSLEQMEAESQKELLINKHNATLKEKNFWIGAISCGSLLLGTSLFAFYRSNKNKQQLQESTIINLQQEKEITNLQAKVEGEEQERSRIAHELHDGIVSQLLSLKLKINALQAPSKPNIAHYELNDVAIQLNEATQDLRRTAHNLMPNLLLQQGLALSVAALCEKIKSNTKLEVTFMAYGILPRLSQDTELALYRMVQELTQNVLKHAQATQLLVQLTCQDHLLTITIEDNGKGIPVTELIFTEKHTGLSHIKKKVALLGGQIDIKSKMGQQTTIYIEFEMDQILKHN